MELSELDAMLKAARQPEKTVPVCLRGDLQADWEQLDKELADLRSESTSTLAGNPAEAELAGRIKALEAQMAEATITLRLRALTRKPWLALIEAHPPREGNDVDKMLGLNGETFFPALLGKSLVEPVFDAERLDRLIDTITSRQYDVLTQTAWDLNRGDISVPFSYTASLITTSSDATSKRQSGSASRTNGSPVGSRKKSSSTSGTTAG